MNAKEKIILYNIINFIDYAQLKAKKENYLYNGEEMSPIAYVRKVSKDYLNLEYNKNRKEKNK